MTGKQHAGGAPDQISGGKICRAKADCRGDHDIARAQHRIEPAGEPETHQATHTLGDQGFGRDRCAFRGSTADHHRAEQARNPRLGGEADHEAERAGQNPQATRRSLPRRRLR